MNTNKNTLDSLLKKEKNITETPLFNENEIRSILGESSGIPFKNVQKKVSIMKISMIVAAAVGSLLSVGLLWNQFYENPKSGTGYYNGIKYSWTVRSEDEAEKLKGQEKKELQDVNEIAKVKMIELSPEELLKFGIRADTSGVWYYANSSQYPGYAWTLNFSDQGTIVPPKVKKSDLPKVYFAPFEPKIVTDKNGAWRMSSYDHEKVSAELYQKMKNAKSEKEKDKYANEISKLADKQLRNNINTFIPIVVYALPSNTVEAQKTERWSHHCIFWYEATPEFLAILPDRFKSQIAVEQKAVETLVLKTETARENIAPMPTPQEILKEVQKEQKIETREILVPEQEKRETGDSYFDVWRSASGAIINTQIFPNPIKDHRSMVRFSLKEERNVVVTLHDIYGRRIAELSKSAAFKSGEHLQEIFLIDVQPGIYLVAIQTDKGEQAVQRIIVE